MLTGLWLDDPVRSGFSTKLKKYGHIYLPSRLGSMRAEVSLVKDNLLIKLVPSPDEGRIKFLFVCPKSLRELIAACYPGGSPWLYFRRTAEGFVARLSLKPEN